MRTSGQLSASDCLKVAVRLRPSRSQINVRLSMSTSDPGSANRLMSFLISAVQSIGYQAQTRAPSRSSRSL